MKRDEYLADEHVAGFTKWVGQLVTGDLTLTHRWKSRGTDFRCTSLYGALEQYRWPDNSRALDYRVTGRRLREFHINFEDIGTVDSRVKQAKFVDNAEAIVRWGGIRPSKRLDEWRSMPPERLQALVEDIRGKLDPETGDTANLAGFHYMGSGFSKVYSVLIDGFPIYDSRVACALNCLVGIYCRRQKVGPKPDSIETEDAATSGAQDCQIPSVRPSQDEQRCRRIRSGQSESGVATQGDGSGTGRVRAS